MELNNIVGMTNDDGKRERPRDSMYLQAVLRPQGGADLPTFTVKVRNISAGGLMGQCEQPVAIDDHIAIDLRNIGRVGGKVAWVNGDRFGVAFDEPIDPKLARQKVSGDRPQPQINGAGFRRAGHLLG